MKVEGRGSIEQMDKLNADGTRKRKALCKRWKLWVRADGKNHGRRFDGSYSDALDALEAFKRELSDFVPNGETFGTYAASWLDWCVSCGSYAPGTVANFRRDIRALERAMGEEAMDEITPETCKAALLNLKHGGSASGRELSNTYMAEIHSTLKAIMQAAEDDGKIARSPMAKIKAPRPDTPERDWLDPMELGLLLNRLDELPLSQWTMVLYLICMLGLRRGEAVALYDSDIETQRDGFGGHVGTAHVKRALKEATGAIDSPKTRAGIRDLPMPPRLCAKVEEWRSVRFARGLADAPTFCCNVDGGAMRPQNLARWWRNNRDALGCHEISLHQLRHSNLSMMARRMSPFDLKDWAGWSSIAPAKVYVHRDMDSMRAAVNDVWQLVGR